LRYCNPEAASFNGLNGIAIDGYDRTLKLPIPEQAARHSGMIPPTYSEIIPLAVPR